MQIFTPSWKKQSSTSERTNRVNPLNGRISVLILSVALMFFNLTVIPANNAAADEVEFDSTSLVTSIAAGVSTYDTHAIIVNGCTLTVDGAHTFESVTLINGGVLTHSTASENLLDLTITGDMNIASGTSIDLSEKGYPGGEGPGQGTDNPNAYDAGGAGHGGDGGSSDADRIAGGESYGTITAPTLLGSGGGNSYYVGGTGGGAVKLTIEGTLIMNGDIHADGGNGADNTTHASGGGSGGSVYITAGEITGSGTITAAGGNGCAGNGGGGAGGRIAVYYNSFDAESTIAISAYGGSGYKVGGTGTIFLKSLKKAHGDLHIKNNGSSGGTTPLAGTYEDVLIHGGGQVIIHQTGELSMNRLTIKETTRVTHPANGSEQEYTLDLTITEDMDIELGSSIDVSKQGYAGGEGDGQGADNPDAYDAGGAGHGGDGGRSRDGNIAGGASYGSITAPTRLGSGGGNAYYVGGAGGGAVKLTIGGTLTLNGGIYANGGDGADNATHASGGGAGGSIYITTAGITGSGTITAAGGNGCAGNGGGGAGGRIAVYYYSFAAESTIAISAYGGSGYKVGGTGTIFLKSSEKDHGDLHIKNNAGSGGTTPLAGEYEDVLFHGGGQVIINQTDALSMKSVTIKDETRVTHPANGSEQEYTLDLIIAGDMDIGSGSSIDVSKQGYAGGEGDGQGTDNPDTYDAGGAGHGGDGGRSRDGNIAGGAGYGSITAPVALGSGGGNSYYTGGAGGGAVKLTIGGTLTLNGGIYANGGDGYDNTTHASGGGAGGSLYITTAGITGSGAITADGGNGCTGNGGGGAGGRIAVYYGNFDPESTIAISAYGGSGYKVGGTGTIFLKALANDNGDLHIINNARSGGITPAAGSYGEVIIGGGGQVVLGPYNSEGSTTTSLTATNLTISGNTTVTQLPNASEQTYALDLLITGTMTIESGSSIDVSEKGYAGGEGPGQGTDNYYDSGGAGHGGNGGRSDAVLGGSSYGSLTEPLTLGSGGGNSNNANYKGGAGGGAVKLTISGTLALNGGIHADGGEGYDNTTHASGGGSGGSIYITAGQITGSGTITAAGGNACNTANGGGGAGGRIAVYYNTLGTGITISAYGGSGYVYGGTGSVYLKYRGSTYGDLCIVNNGSTGSVTPISGEYRNVTIGGGGQVVLEQAGPVSMENLTIKDSTTVTHLSNSSDREYTLDLAITGDMFINTNSGIDVSQKGYAGGEGPGQGTDNYYDSGGAGHGGNGGHSDSAQGGTGYGSLTQPLTLGSGGGNSNNAYYKGGAGGGAVKLAINGTLTLDGYIHADGGDGCDNTTHASGGGSGGSVYITAGEITGSGTITSDGGIACNTANGGGGAGGRIAVYYDTLDTGIIISAYGGSGYKVGGTGTIFLKDSAADDGDLYIANNSSSGGITPISGDYGDVVIHGGGQVVLEQTGSFSMAGLTISEETTLTHPANTSEQEFTLDLIITGDMTMESDSSIDVSKKGYIGSEGPGQGTDHYYDSGGAGHGGDGGSSEYVEGGAEYGNLTEPLTLGSGGGNSCDASYKGGAGGGAVKLTIGGTLTLDGDIHADGGNGSDHTIHASGGGSGGSVYITAGEITVSETGSGTITAAGGNACNIANGGGGAGGRIAFNYFSVAPSEDIRANVSVAGGTGYGNGEDGTVYYTTLANPVITTHNGVDFTTSESALVLEGTCPAGTARLLINDDPDGVTFTAGGTWQKSVSFTEGNNDVYVQAIDGSSNESGRTKITITLDTTPEGAPAITTNAGGDMTVQLSAFILEGTCAADMVTILVNGSEDGVTYVAGETTWTYETGLSPGENFISVTGRDEASNESLADTITITFENNLPDQPVNIEPSNGAVSVNPYVTLTASDFNDADTDDTHTTTQWRVRTADGSYDDPVFFEESATNLTGITLSYGTLELDTTYSWQVRYRDCRGSWSDYSVETSFTTLLDTEPPETTISSGPSDGGIVYDSTAGFAWTAVDNVQWQLTYAVRLDDGEWSEYSSDTSIQYTGLEDGDHVFRVKAMDYSGNEDPSPATRSFTIQSAPENVTSLAVQSGAGTLTFTWDHSVNTMGDLDHYLIYFNGSTTGETLDSTESQYQATGLDPSTAYTFKITAVDTGGNESSGVSITGYTVMPNPVVHPPEALSGRVTLSWDAVTPSEYVKNYRIYKSTGSFTSVAGMSPVLTSTGTSISVAGLANGTTYHFAVTTVNLSGGEGQVGITTVSATPRADTFGPAFSNITLNGTAISNNMAVNNSAAINCNATDESGVSRVEYLINGTVYTDTSGSNYSCQWDILSVDDGPYTIQITAYDTLGNATTVSYSVTVALPAPPAPAISAPVSGKTVNTPSISVSGTAQKLAYVQIDVNETATGNWTAVDSKGKFTISTPLSEGINTIRAKAKNRAGESPSSNPVTISLDTSIPDSPAHLKAASAASGVIALTWSKPLDTTVQGYNLYRSTTAFTTIEQGTKLNSALITALTYKDLPDEDGEYYYGITAVDYAGNESALSATVSGVSDRMAPQAVTIEYAPEEHYDSSTGRMGTGIVYVTLTVSEPLVTTPFLSINPVGAVPMTIDLDQESELIYTGVFVIDENTPAGPAWAVFSARDKAGNRGDTIASGDTVEIDTEGPALIDIQINPEAPIQNDGTGLFEVTVVLGLNEAVKDEQAPGLSYLLSGEGRAAVQIAAGDISRIDTEDGHAETWQAVFTLSSDAGLEAAETLEFIYSAMDDLDNASDEVTADNAFQIYQGSLPPLAAPTGLAGVSLPAGEIRLTWDAVDQAAGYLLYRQAPGEAGLSLLAELGEITEYLDTPGEDGTYTYAVTSLRTGNGETAESGRSPSIEVVSDGTAPGAPSNLALTLTARGIQAAWDAPADTEQITCSLYRAASEIISVEGLTPVRTGIEDTAAIDTKPSETLPYYVVTAVDQAGNESDPCYPPAYLNVDLLPVNDLTVTRTNNEHPVITWTHSGASINGYHIYLGPEGSLTRLNTGLLEDKSYTDTGYDGSDRRYTVEAVDTYAVPSLGRSITLPKLKASLPKDAGLKRGLMNRLEYTVSNSGATDVEDAVLQVTVESHEHVSASFDLGAGKSLTVPVVIGGYSDLPDTSSIETVIRITPNDGETVQIATTCDIAVGTGMLKLSFTNDEFVRSTAGEIVFTLENTGDEQIEIVTAESGGKSSADITLYLNDEEGNTLSTGTYTQKLGSSVVTLASGRTVARIEPGETFESQPMSITVPSGAPDEMQLVLKINRIYHALGEDNEVVMSGVRTKRDITLIDTAYYGEILSIAPDTSTGDQDIEITGQAVDRGDGDPLADVPLSLFITINGFERSVDVFTGSDGTFTYAFEPRQGEYGDYEVCAIHPDRTDRPVHGSFTINDPNDSLISFSPAIYNLTAVRNYEYDIVVTAKAGSLAETSNLGFVYEAADQDGGTFPDGIYVEIGDPVQSLSANGTATLPITVWADNTADENSTLVLHLVSGESGQEDWGTLTVNVNCLATDNAAAGPALSYSPSYIETGLALDESTSETLTIENKGYAELSGLSVKLVNADGSNAPSWAVLNLPADQESIEIGESVDVTLLFYPTESSVSQGDYVFYVQVRGSNYEADRILVHVAVTDSGTGSVLFKVADIYTATIDQDTGEMIQGLSGASLSLQNETVTSVSYTAKTDEYGEILLSDLPAGRYKYYLTADKHDQVTGRVWIKPGITITEDVFMGYNLVSVEWSVTETTIEDKYEIVLTATYETDVPAAVVVAEPASVTLPDMEPGDVLVGEIRFTNYGLIRAEEIEFSLPDSNEYFKYELLASVPDTIEAKESITVPYRVTCLASLTGGDDGAGGDCVTYSDKTCLWYLYVCSNGTHYEEIVCSGFTWAGGDCSGGTYAIVSGGGGGGGGTSSGGWASGGGGGGTTTGSYTPSGVTADGVVCSPIAVCEVFDECCKANARARVGSYVNLLNGEYEDDVVDMFLKIPGDVLVVRRFFYDQAWHFENNGAELTFNYKVDSSTPESITKDGVDYEKSDTAGTVYTFNKIKHIYRDSGGYLWKDRIGNWIQYDTEGRIQYRGNQDQTNFTYVYDENNPDLLTHVLDKNQGIVLWYEYNADGQVVLAKDSDSADARQVSYQYTGGYLTQVTDLLGNVFSYTYDADGRMTSKTDQIGRTMEIEYNTFGWVAAVIDADGNRTEYSYSQNDAANERYNMITYANGRVRETWYDEKGRVARIDLNGITMEENIYENRKQYKTDERGYTWIYEFDEWGQLIKKTYPDDSYEVSEYDPDTQLLIRRTQRNGTEITYEYDENGNLTERILAPGTDNEIVYQYTYDDNGNQLTQTIAGDDHTLESVTTMAYDDYGNMVSKTDPEGNTTTYTYNNLGVKLTQKDPRGNTWAFTYDDAGNLKTQTDPLGNVTRYEYNAAGNRVSVTDAMGGVVEYTYDANDRKLSQTDPMGNTTVYERDFEGKTLQETDAEGKFLVYEYDGLGRLISQGNSAGKQITYEYDENSVAGCAACSNGGLEEPSVIRYPTMDVRHVYDRLGRKIQERYELDDGATVHERLTGYDIMGNVTDQTDMNGITHTVEYDAINRKAKEIRPDGTRISYTYDKRKNMLGLTDANGHTTAFEYDRNNRLIRETRPEGQETVYDYDENSNLTQRTDARGRITQYDYNKVNKLEEIRYYASADAASQDPDTPDKTITFAYNETGKLTAYNDGEFLARYEYDLSQRKIRETVTCDDFTKTWAYEYYKNGLKKSFTAPDGTLYEYTYTEDKQLGTISIPGVGTVSYNDYAWSEPDSILLPGGTLREFTYDDFYRPGSITTKDPGDNTVMDQAFVYDNEDNVTSVTTLTGTVTYDYDQQYRLTGVVDSSNGAVSYLLDDMGNRLSQTGATADWTYNGNDQLLTAGDAEFTYDLNGNMISKTTGSQTFNYTYDHEDRLIRIDLDSGDTPTPIAAYGYDPFGRRTWKAVDGTKTYFIYAEEGLVAEFNDAGDLIRAYGYSPVTVNSNNPVFIKSGTSTCFYHTDRLKKPVKITDISGAVVWSATYDAYGQAQVDAGSTLVNNLRLPGQYFDEESGLHYNRHRYYDPATGRYIQADPLGLGNRPNAGTYQTSQSCIHGYNDIDINYYVYADANPINKIDPFGTLSIGLGVELSTGCIPILGAVGIEASGKAGLVQCCNCETRQMESMHVVEVCLMACGGIDPPSIKMFLGLDASECCPKGAEGELELKAECSLPIYSCGVSLKFPPFPPGPPTVSCSGGGSYGLKVPDLEASCKAGGCGKIKW